MESSQTRDWIHVPCIGRQIHIPHTTREVPECFSAEKNGTCMQMPAGPGRNIAEWNRSMWELSHILPTMQRNRLQPHRDISSLLFVLKYSVFGLYFFISPFRSKKNYFSTIRKPTMQEWWQIVSSVQCWGSTEDVRIVENGGTHPFQRQQPLLCFSPSLPWGDGTQCGQILENEKLWISLGMKSRNF